jgi:chromosome segregation ATPase
MSEEDARATADRILIAEGGLTVRRLAQAIGGDTAWVSQIAREAKANRARVTTDAVAREPDCTAEVPAKVRDAADTLVQMFASELQRAVAAETARSRSTEVALRADHERFRSELEHELADASEQLRELEEIIAELGSEATIARAGAARADELERMLHVERERHAEQVERLQADVRTATEAERRSAEVRHAAEVDQARAEAEFQSASAALEVERAGRRTVEDRLATVEASRSTLHHQLQTVKAQLAETQRSLDAERATARRLEMLVGDHLGDSTSDAKPRRRGKPAAKATATP